MGLFKKMTDPTPGGGLTGDDPEEAKRVNDSRDLVSLNAPEPATSSEARIVDPTSLIMGGVAASARIDAIRPAAKEINLQTTFEVTLRVTPAEGDSFVARVVQPVAEEYVALAVVGQPVACKFDPDDHGAVWINWASSTPSS